MRPWRDPGDGAELFSRDGKDVRDGRLTLNTRGDRVRRRLLFPAILSTHWLSFTKLSHNLHDFFAGPRLVVAATRLTNWGADSVIDSHREPATSSRRVSPPIAGNPLLVFRYVTSGTRISRL